MAGAAVFTADVFAIGVAGVAAVGVACFTAAGAGAADVAGLAGAAAGTGAVTGFFSEAAGLLSVRGVVLHEDLAGVAVAAVAAGLSWVFTVAVEIAVPDAAFCPKTGVTARSAKLNIKVLFMLNLPKAVWPAAVKASLRQ